MASIQGAVPDSKRVVGFVELLRPEEIEQVEREYAHGVPARFIVELFAKKGVPLSEATFRKYVQSGLLPRSRRVGRKGKHRGSQGLYPVESIRRVNAIKRMMAQGLTLEDIKASFVVLKNHIEHANRELSIVFDGFERQLEDRDFGAAHKKALASELKDLRVQARQLLQQVSKFGSAVTARDQAHAVAWDA
ncbi:MAG: MerR family transcriptional regulator [Myxococcota bacterium]